jgi:hypothetical protein
MQPTTSPTVAAPIGRTERPPVSPLAQLVAKVLNVPVPTETATSVPVPEKDQPPVRTDGRDIRPGSRLDIRV